ncbi:MAG: tetratricopeptide repeat protein [Gammaproteobacteria bacterium]|nr:tetratricopeptide repeat protein [Gammaproteobacteria bacterium]
MNGIQYFHPGRSLSWLLLVTPMMLAGCATHTQPTSEDTPGYLDGMRIAEPGSSSAVAKGIDQETLYSLLVAEIAGQRDKLDVAVEHYRTVARKTRDPQIIERAIRIAVYARDDAAAADIARLWLEVDPGNTDARQVLAAVAVRAGDVDTAVGHLERILNSGEGVLGQKLWLIANMLSREKDKDTILTVMERLVASYRDNPDALFAYAHVAVRMDDLDLAQRLLKQVLDQQPDNLNAVMNYVSVLQKNGEQQVALDWLARNLDEYSNNFNLRLIYARLLTDARRFDEARAQFEQLSAEAPDNPDVLYALGLLSLQANQLEEADGYFQRLIELGERVHESRYYLGRIAEEQGRVDDAAAYYMAVEQSQNFIDAQIRMSVILTRQDKIEQALEHLDGIQPASDGDRKQLAQAEAEILIHEKRYQEAMEIYDAALEQSEDDTDLLYSRAMLAEKMDRLGLMERDLRAILRQDPEHAQALNALGYTLADRTDRLQEAYELIERALEVSPDDFYILDSMGWVLYRMGRLDEAVTYLRRALKQRKDPEVAAHLGEVLWVKGKREEAREVWETALQATPDDERLLDVIQRFNP